ncbi:ATP-binding cassette domain-containing protein [Periweissella cryptocerci]|uniref:ATP-binding cassette domain-containing protein n=2 Tax=Periweissella cryptocerci TaxID=2506420 RepID=A0A4P6YX74_9LACO|nr:ATP-binding cassette domain-containing protein [Periweissella cryptocerci]
MLQIINGTKQYGNTPALLQNVNLKFEPGKMYALIGPSGIGKSTILNSLAKLDELTSGQIMVDDTDLYGMSVITYFREYLGYLFQNYALIEEDTVQQNLRLVRRYPVIELQTALEKFGLSASYLKRKVYSLSGGEAQRVALARLYLKNPPIILADEPTGALDKGNTKLVVQSLQAMAQSNKIVIVATHDDYVANQADVVIDVSQFHGSN